MRTIKFRAWDKESKNMVYVGGSFMDVSQTQGVDRWVFGCDVFNHPDNIELMQSTNLQDGKGVVVFEGDIIREKDTFHSFIVKWSEMRCGFVCASELVEENKVLDISVDRQNWEVIGNIYSNPELITN